MNTYTLAALLAVPAVFAAAEPGRANELEDKIKKYATGYYTEAQKGTDRSYPQIAKDIIDICRDGGVKVDTIEGLISHFEQQGSAFVLTVSHDSKVDIQLGKIQTREKTTATVLDTPVELEVVTVYPLIIGSYNQNIRSNGTGAPSLLDVKNRRMYLFLDNLFPHARAAWDISNGKWDYAISDQFPKSRDTVPLVKEEFADIPRSAQDEFVSTFILRERQRLVEHEAAHLFLQSRRFKPEIEEAYAEIITGAHGTLRTSKNISSALFSPENSHDYKWASHALTLLKSDKSTVSRDFRTKCQEAVKELKRQTK
ncbi:MAG TPA: hypothetical protein VJB66_03275 [Candidatus Nanoarchaeia archaeon]|nr:hypothetical protein [Candidatus Nanoarchaeia archaeon]